MKVITPLNGHVLIRPRKATTAPAGIDIPESVDKEKATVGEVVIGGEVGPKMFNVETHKPECKRVEPGQFVLFNAFAPRKVQHGGEDCLLVNGEDIYAVIEE